VAVTGADTVEVVVTAPDHRVYHNRLEDGVWAGWIWTGLESDTAPALLSSPTDNGLELFVTGRDGRLYHSRLINDVWGTPWPLGAVSGQPAAATVGTDGGLELLMAGADGNLWHNRFRPNAPDLTSLSGQVQRIFDAHCVQCHDTGDAESDQNLEQDNSYSSIVQVSAEELPFMHRIEPGSPEKSYLYHKITGTQAEVGGSGERMPKGGQLSDAEIATIRAWIAQGALDN
jgi:mono/diheme cytochrome c family protein